MGWCSGTYIFDAVAKVLLDDKPVDKKAMLITLIDALEDGDWDCHSESAYWDNPIVREAMKERHPSWFEDEQND
jgi:hypothetical protein